jgi:hypothetical protein
MQQLPKESNGKFAAKILIKICYESKVRYILSTTSGMIQINGSQKIQVCFQLRVLIEY